MLTAKEAHDIASEKFVSFATLIERAARQQRFNLDLDVRINDELTKHLENLGYKVEDLSVPRYEETPYGYTNNIIGELTRIRISW